MTTKVTAPRLEFALAQLRHAYKHGCDGTIGDQRAFVDGLIAPAIEVLEHLEADPSGGSTLDKIAAFKMVDGQMVECSVQELLGQAFDYQVRSDSGAWLIDQLCEVIKQFLILHEPDLSRETPPAVDAGDWRKALGGMKL